MRTQFSPAQLLDPATREVEQILRKCVHCGFCNATCPTYTLKGDELDGPRGRIYLLKDMLENESRPDTKVVKHIDRCLSCLSCMTICPSGVDYMHLIDHGRDYIEKHHNRKLIDKLFRQILASILPSPNRFRWSLKLSRLAQPFINYLPRSMKAGLNLAQQSNLESGKQTFESTYPGESPIKGRIGLIPGCAQQVVANEINMASIRLLNRNGFDVELLAESECCAAIEHHLGKTSQALKRVRTNLKDWSSRLPQLDAIISNASGCGTMLKDYQHLLKGDDEFSTLASQVSNKTMDVCEFLVQHEFSINHNVLPEAFTVAYQNPCSMQHGQKINEQPTNLLKEFGFNTIGIPDAHLCCGSAGTYNILQSELATELGNKKAASIESTSADLIASGNLGCILQLRQYSDLPIMHTVQLLDWASGGPMPPELTDFASGEISEEKYS
ncbi:MAG: glycolate oxidase subunit GlcF [Gammaproteobacteria bacterium]|nr:glycolate oxidase subunit GlcF [Gammaproteobacteria bacterium]